MNEPMDVCGQRRRGTGAAWGPVWSPTKVLGGESAHTAVLPEALVLPSVQVAANKREARFGSEKGGLRAADAVQVAPDQDLATLKCSVFCFLFFF